MLSFSCNLFLSLNIRYYYHISLKKKKKVFFWLYWVFLLQGRFSSCGEWELLIVVHRLLTAVASLVVEHRL